MKKHLFFTLCALFISVQTAQAQTWQVGSPNLADVTATLTPDGTFTISGTVLCKILLGTQYLGLLKAQVLKLR